LVTDKLVPLLGFYEPFWLTECRSWDHVKFLHHDKRSTEKTTL